MHPVSMSTFLPPLTRCHQQRYLAKLTLALSFSETSTSITESVTLKTKLQAQMCVKYIAETSEFDGLMVK